MNRVLVQLGTFNSQHDRHELEVIWITAAIGRGGKMVLLQLQEFKA